MVRKYQTKNCGSVKSLRVHHGNEVKYEFSESAFVSTLFHPTSFLASESEDNFFWITRVQLFDLEESAYLYFDDRPTVKDALLLLWNTLRPNLPYTNAWALSETLFSPPLNENYQISLYLTEVCKFKFIAKKCYSLLFIILLNISKLVQNKCSLSS